VIKPIEDKYLKQLIQNTLFAVKCGNCSVDGGTANILGRLEKDGYHCGLNPNTE